jgi:hypothetical protein
MTMTKEELLLNLMTMKSGELVLCLEEALRCHRRMMITAIEGVGDDLRVPISTWIASVYGASQELNAMSDEELEALGLRRREEDE